jgi:hypothetical protein
MAAIDIGPGATNRPTTIVPLYTELCLDNPANDTGTLTSFEMWYNTNATGVKIGTFSGSGTSYTSRDVESIGNVTSGAKRTSSGLNCSVSSGDFIGEYCSTGYLEYDTSGFAGTYWKAGDWFGAGAQTYALGAGNTMSLYSTGTTSGWANITKICGITSTTISKVDGIAVANISKVCGIVV